ncbi:MAG: MBL fold metallo-hydrolase [Methylocystaceae bacterium]
MEKALKIISVLVIFVVLINILLVIRFYSGKKAVAVHNNTLTSSHLDLPEVSSLEIMPVVDNHIANEKLIPEDAVSYYIKTDNDRILFDVGWNKKAAKTSPMLSNLGTLGLSFTDFTALVISHNHPDHVGGMSFRDKEITAGVKDLTLPIYTPMAMTCGGKKTTAVTTPSLLGQEIGSTGPLTEQMYIPGRVYEQALMVNVKGKGLVLISGCGHPQINTMVREAAAITNLPVYAVVGGTHLFYTSVESAFWRQVMGSTKVFSRGTTKAEVEKTVNTLKDQRVQKVYISGHDADQASLDIFRSAFGSGYAVVTVGQPIKF